MSEDTLPITALLPGTLAEPVVMYDSHAALRLGVVEREGAGRLGDEWDVPGVYVLLDPVDTDGNYGVYVGKAPSGIRGRLLSHVRNKDHWRRALLVARDTTFGFHSAQVGWLEGRLYDLLDAAEYAALANGNRPKDETLPPHDRAVLEACVLPVNRVLRLLGYSAETADEGGTPDLSGRRRTSRFYGITLATLAQAGLLRPGLRLVSTNGVYPATAVVGDNGEVVWEGKAYDSPSRAAQDVRGGGAANGWDFWAVEDERGRTTLGTLRARFLDQGGQSTSAGPA